MADLLGAVTTTLPILTSALLIFALSWWDLDRAFTRKLAGLSMGDVFRIGRCPAFAGCVHFGTRASLWLRFLAWPLSVACATTGLACLLVYNTVIREHLLFALPYGIVMATSQPPLDGLPVQVAVWSLLFYILAWWQTVGKKGSTPPEPSEPLRFLTTFYLRTRTAYLRRVVLMGKRDGFVRKVVDRIGSLAEPKGKKKGHNGKRLVLDRLQRNLSLTDRDASLNEVVIGFAERQGIPQLLAEVHSILDGKSHRRETRAEVQRKLELYREGIRSCVLETTVAGFQDWKTLTSMDVKGNSGIDTGAYRVRKVEKKRMPPTVGLSVRRRVLSTGITQTYLVVNEDSRAKLCDALVGR